MVSGGDGGGVQVTMTTHTLCEDGVDGENGQGEERGGADEDPNDMPDQKPGKKGADIIGIERSYAPDGEPFEMNLLP